MNYQLALDNPTVTDVINDDAVILHLQYSTQWDSLAHVGQLFDAERRRRRRAGVLQRLSPRRAHRRADRPQGRRRHRPGARPTRPRAKALGVENMAVKCVQGRGVMIDLHAHVGRERAVSATTS